jgi:hypothetical protein
MLAEGARVDNARAGGATAVWAAAVPSDRDDNPSASAMTGGKRAAHLIRAVSGAEG